ncbi:MAG TPA: transcription antitermination factor NusB [Slackia equolifaciens]|uniref:Transcription antitermination protein NusB n=1 Tax=Slackia equolifaciens TaxID=498718 RepID=A0A9D2UWP2_9ACTN|nr:transcription antitermination factor NusB [Slackia equolifaciens]
MAKRHERTLARRSALQALYQSEILGVPADKVLEENLLPEEAGMDDYARSLVMGVASHAAHINAAISGRSQNWAIDRMPVVDRCVLRLAVYEMSYVDDVPVSVAINEAVELAKEFGGEDDSHRFVNGVLGRIARDMESESGNAAAEDAAGDEPADGAAGLAGDSAAEVAVASAEAAADEPKSE